MLGATVLGGGTRAFDAGPISLRLLDTRTVQGSSNVLLHYPAEADAS